MLSSDCKSRTRWFFAALLVATLSAHSQQSVPSQNHRDWKARDAWQRPEEVMNTLRLRAGSAVADVGCGEGYFTYHLAERVGPQGKVFAVDIQERLIEQLRHQTLSQWLVQVRPMLGAPADPHLPTGRLDAVLVVIAYHEIHEHDAMVERFYSSLKPGGRLGIIEFEAPDRQPRERSFELHQIPARTVREEVEQHGFRFLTNEPGFSSPESKKKQYFLLFEKPEE